MENKNIQTLVENLNSAQIVKKTITTISKAIEPVETKHYAAIAYNFYLTRDKQECIAGPFVEGERITLALLENNLQSAHLVIESVNEVLAKEDKLFEIILTFNEMNSKFSVILIEYVSARYFYLKPV